MRVDTHRKFDTIDHEHVVLLVDDLPLCLMIVKCRNGHYYLEQEFESDDFSQFQDVCNPWDFKDPVFYEYDMIKVRLKEIVNELESSG